MPEIMAHELDAWERLCFGAVVVGTIFPAKGDGVVGEGEHARIVNGGASDVGTEIFDGRSAGTGGLDMHTPIFAPERWVDWPVILFK